VRSADRSPRAPNLLDVGAQGISRFQFIEDETGVAQDDGEQIVEVVRNASRERTDGVHLLQLPEVLFGAPHVGLSALLFGEVAGDLGCADHLSSGITDGRKRKGDLDERAIFAKACRFVALDRLAEQHVTHEHRDLRIAHFLRHDRRDVFAHDLLGFPLEEPLRAAVPAGDLARDVSTENGIVGRLDDRREARCFLVSLHPFRDVANVGDDRPHRGIVQLILRARLDPAPGPVTMPYANLVRDVGRHILDQCPTCGFSSRKIVGVDEIQDFLTDPLFPCVAQHPEERPAGVTDGLVGLREQDQVGAVLDHRLEARLGTPSLGQVSKHHQVQSRQDICRRRKFDVALLPVRSREPGLTGAVPVAHAPCVERAVFLRPEILDVSGEQLFARDTEQLARRRVDVFIIARVVCEQHRVQRAVEDRPKLVLAFSKLLLRRLQEQRRLAGLFGDGVDLTTRKRAHRLLRVGEAVA